MQFFADGAGPGPGLKGPGSQWATDQASSSDGGSASGSGDNSDSESSENAAPGVAPALSSAPFVISGLVALFTLVGAVAL